jgi:hypothetical protein
VSFVLSFFKKQAKRLPKLVESLMAKAILDA